MSDPFDIHDDSNEQLEVPADLLPHIKDFHQVRSRLLKEVKQEQAAMQAAQEAMQTAQVRYNARITEINSELDEAIFKVRDICVEHKLVVGGEDFFLDTSRVMKHDKAYVIKPQRSDNSEAITAGNRTLN